jgi:DNA repair exonuclease SbcCD ATPase subunit
MATEAKPATAATTGGEQTTTQQAGGEHGKSTATGFDVTRAFFGSEGTQPDDESAESGAEAPPESAEGATDNQPDDGTEIAGNTGSETSGDNAEVWQFDGIDYTPEQVSDALKQRGMYERFNQTITPLIQSVNTYEETARRLSVMAQTEAEKEIAELQRALSSGKLESREYQQAHLQLTRAQQRLEILNSAAQQEIAQRQKTLTEARTHNARQIGVGLIKSGWTMNQINEVQALAQEFMTPEQFADSLSTGLMEALKDAAELRRMKEKSAAELRGKAKKAVKVNNNGAAAPVRAPKGAGMGSPDWISKNFWGR